MNIVALLFGFKGRIQRLQWWLGMIAVDAILVGVLWLLGMPTWNRPEALVHRFVGFLLETIALYPIAALAVKRLHDRDYSNWVAFPWLAVLFASFIGELFRWFDGPSIQGPWKLTVTIILAAIELGYLVELGFRGGISGSNRYGPGPRSD